ncbi:MAG: heme-binding domain-containing protein [Myxococcota bacterium]|nr:heme-binding domain-containing protein [Myxococcales bacterium]
MSMRIALAAVALLAAIQLVPVDRSNPPVTSEVPADPATREILRRACYDCHSNETRWPWYARVAPVSWLVAHDVEEGREHVNFSTWNEYTAKKQRKKLDEVWEEVEEGEMPLWFYVPLHPDAKLGEADLRAIEAWAKAR